MCLWSCSCCAILSIFFRKGATTTTKRTTIRDARMRAKRYDYCGGCVIALHHQPTPALSKKRKYAELPCSKESLDVALGRLASTRRSSYILVASCGAIITLAFWLVFLCLCPRFLVRWSSAILTLTIPELNRSWFCDLLAKWATYLSIWFVLIAAIKQDLSAQQCRLVAFGLSCLRIDSKNDACKSYAVQPHCTPSQVVDDSNNYGANAKRGRCAQREEKTYHHVAWPGLWYLRTIRLVKLSGVKIGLNSMMDSK